MDDDIYRSNDINTHPLTPVTLTLTLTLTPVPLTWATRSTSATAARCWYRTSSILVAISCSMEADPTSAGEGLPPAPRAEPGGYEGVGVGVGVGIGVDLGVDLGVVVNVDLGVVVNVDRGVREDWRRVWRGSDIYIYII